jgi:hypothetical protein
MRARIVVVIGVSCRWEGEKEIKDIESKWRGLSM